MVGDLEDLIGTGLVARLENPPPGVALVRKPNRRPLVRHDEVVNVDTEATISVPHRVGRTLRARVPLACGTLAAPLLALLPGALLRAGLVAGAPFGLQLIELGTQIRVGLLLRLALEILLARLTRPRVAAEAPVVLLAVFHGAERTIAAP